MSQPAAGAMRRPTMDDPDPIVAAALALGPQIRAAADEIEQGRRLPLPIVQAMKEAGVFRVVLSR